jgi:DNA-binding FrmR family transcriptional regulator
MKKDITARLRNVIGQLEAILRMREYDAPCDVQLTQLKAVRAGISAVMQKIIEDEIAHCSKQSQREKVVEKLVAQLVHHT